MPEMNSIEQHINSINTKLQQLLKKYAVLKKENAALINELELRRSNEKAHLDKIDSLEVQAGILKASSGKMDEKEKRDFERRINQYIKELDKCIAILNN
jgi:hypothetical protein